MELNSPPAELSLAPIHTIKRNLDRMFGEHAWDNFELETISLELGIGLDELTQDKICVIQTLNQSIGMFSGDVLFFLHAVNVINNNIADFDTFPMPTSLEIAYAYTEVVDTFNKGTTLTLSSAVKKTVAYILNHEGYSEPVAPFNQMGIVATDLVPGQLPEDTANKAKAVQRYLEAMKG
jgi:hypothetical protein